MADGNISMSHQGLAAAAADIRSRKDALKRKLQQASVTVEQVTSRAYKTRTASGDFKSAHDEWNRSTGVLMDSLNEVSDGIDQTIRIDEQTDQQARGKASEIRGSGGSRGAVAAGGAAAGGAAVAAGTAARSRAGGSGGSGGGRSGGNGGGPPGGGGGGARGANSGDPNDGSLARPRAGWEKRPLLNGQERTRQVRDPSPDRRAAGDPERLPGKRQQQNRDNIDRQNKNGDLMEQQGYGDRVRHQPKDQPPHIADPTARTTADYKIGDRYFEHKVPHTSNVRSFVDNNLEKAAARWLREGKQAERFVVDLSNGPFTPDQLRAELVQRVTSGQGTGVQEVFVIQNGHVLYLFP